MASNRAFQNPNDVDFRDLKKFAQPRKCFKPTESLKDALKLIENKDENKIIHVHGMSGSGKSQTVAAACKHLNDDPGRIIWHVQCRPGSNAFLKEMKELAENLQTAGLINLENKLRMRSAVEKGSNEMWKFVDVLNEITLSEPVLVVVEDLRADSEEKQLIKYLIGAMMNSEAEVLNVQLVLASREREVLYIDEDLKALKAYATLKISGFTEEEAIKFLAETSEIESSGTDVITKLAEELRYSPLRLLVAKTYCHKYKISYDKYFSSLGKDEGIVKKEKELMKQHPDLGEYHGYEVIMKLFTPTENSDEEMGLQFKVMKMLSFLNNFHIPSVLLEKFFQEVMKGQPSKHENATVVLRERLRREVEAEENDFRDMTLLTVHADILRAINACMDLEEKQEVLKQVIFALGTLLDKDNRMKKDYGLLNDLKVHAEGVAVHAASHGITVETKDCHILLGLSRLNEGIGFAISQHPGFREGNEEEEYYKRALDCIWMVVCSHFGKSFLPSWLTKKKTGEKAKQLIHFEEGKDPQKTAKEIYKMAKTASLENKNIMEALEADKERLFRVKVEHIGDMKKKLGDGGEIDWDIIVRELQENGRLAVVREKQLVKHHLVIEWKKLAEVYLVERMASILHSRGRQDNYKGDIISQEMRNRCLWYTELGFQLCDVAYKKSGVKSLFHYILRGNNKLPRLTRNREDEIDLHFLERIEEARETALSLKNEDGDFYEHGIYKQISGTPWTVMNALKYLVKANTKVHKRPEVLRDFAVHLPQADGEGEEFYEIAKNNPQIVISTTCLVHAGKYFAARKQYEKSLQTFEMAFEQGINDKVQTNQTTYGWALYNFGRAIRAAGPRFRNRDQCVKRFGDRYKLTKNNNTPKKWIDLLDECKKNLDE